MLRRAFKLGQGKLGLDPARLPVVEMLPAPDQAWLTDARGQRYTAELRMVAVDQKTADRNQEG